MAPPLLPFLSRRNGTPVPARSVRVGGVLIDLATHEVFRDDAAPQRLSPKAVQVLLVLLAHGDQPIHREQLIARAWPGQFRTDDVVTKAMQELRRALSDQPDQLVIETIPRVGYRLKLPFEWLDEAAGDRPPVASPAALPPAAANQADATRVDPELHVPDDAALRAVTDARPIARGVRPRWAFAAMLMLAFAVGAGIRYAGRDSPALPAGASFASAQVAPRMQATPLRADPGDEAYAAIAPDGTLVAIAAKGEGDAHYRLRVRDLESGGERLVLDAAAGGDELAPSWSRDGRDIAYYRNDNGACTLEIASAMGLGHRVLTGCVAGLPMPIEFTPDDSALIVARMALSAETRKPGFLRVDLKSGRVSEYDVGPAAAFGLELEARFSPDGRKLLIQRGVAPFSSLVLVDLEHTDGDPGHALGERFSSISGVTWLPDNRHAVVASDNLGTMELWRVDTMSGKLERFGGLSGRQPSAARSRELLVYSRLDRPSGLRLIDVHAGAAADRASPLFASTRADSAPAITRDGQRVAFVSDRMGQAQIFLGDVDGGSATPITMLTAGRPFDLSFSSDGRQLAYGLRLDGALDVQVMDVATRTVATPKLGIERTIDLRFGDEPGQLLFTAWDADETAHVYAQQQDDPASAHRVSRCAGRAPRAGGDGWIYFLGAGPPMLKRVRADGVDADCEPVSDRVRWLNRNAWASDGADVFAILTPLDRVARAGLYRLAEPPQLLLDLPELALRPTANIELVGQRGRMIAALPAAASSDVWLVRGEDSGSAAGPAR